uniref:UDENN domain-containing protein n=1 Tax=Arcella intermedia TaxID=1963864 RepID=A0A6B2L153_9EUKA
MMLPEGVQKRDWDYTIFLLNREQTAKKIATDDWELVKGDGFQKTQLQKQLSLSSNIKIPKLSGLMYCYNLIHSKKDRDAQRGVVIKALAIVCTHQFFHIYRPFIWQTLKQYYDNPSTEMLQNLYTHLNSIDLSKVLQIKKKHHRYWNATSNLEKYYSLFSDYEGNKVYMSIPLHFLPDETIESSISLILDTFGEKTSLIYQSILLEKRIVVCGHGLPAWLTCKYVFSLCLLAVPMEGILRARAYPYMNFGSFDFLNTSGYILGMANPFLKDKGSEYWDVFCDITTKEVITETPGPASFSGYFKVFKQEISETAKSDPNLDMIRRCLNGLHRNYGESWIRQQFKRHTMDIISSTLIDEIGDKNATPLNTSKPNFDKLFISQFKTKKSYQKWANENLHLLSQDYHPGLPVSKPIWDLNQMIKKLKSKMNRNTSNDASITRSWMIVVTQKIIELATDDDQLMEVFTILAENRLSLAEKIAKIPSFPEDLKQQWLNIEARQQFVLSELLKHD